MAISISKHTDAFPQPSAPGVSPGRVGKASMGLQTLPDQVTVDLVALFKLLADETRLRVLFLLRQRDELNVRTLCKLLGQSQPAVSHHLALLRAAGLLEMRRDGKHNFYRLMPKRFEELVGMLFAVSPNDENQIRFDDYVLSYSQA
jgi:ArsR family transcriptional regulator